MPSATSSMMSPPVLPERQKSCMLWTACLLYIVETHTRTHARCQAKVQDWGNIVSADQSDASAGLSLTVGFKNNTETAEPHKSNQTISPKILEFFGEMVNLLLRWMCSQTLRIASCESALGVLDGESHVSGHAVSLVGSPGRTSRQSLGQTISRRPFLSVMKWSGQVWPQIEWSAAGVQEAVTLEFHVLEQVAKPAQEAGPFSLESLWARLG